MRLGIDIVAPDSGHTVHIPEIVLTRIFVPPEDIRLGEVDNEI
jgi:hypothetical protein